MNNFINIYKQNPTVAINQAAAESAKMWLNGNRNTAESVQLKTHLTEVLTALINEGVLVDLANQSGSNDGYGGVSFPVTIYPVSQAKGNQLSLTRFREMDFFYTVIANSSVREVPYTNPNFQDYTLAGLTGLFEKFIGQNIKQIKVEFSKWMAQLILLNVPADNLYASKIDLTTTTFLNNTTPQSIVNLKNAIVKAMEIGVTATNDNSAAIVSNGLVKEELVIAMSQKMVMISNATLSLRATASSDKAIDIFQNGLYDTGKDFDGIKVVVANELASQNLNWVLMTKGSRAPIAFGYSYIGSTMDRVQGSVTAFVSNTEYRSWMSMIAPYSGFLWAEVNSTDKNVITGSLVPGTSTATTLTFSGTVKALGTATFTDIKFDVMDATNTVVSTGSLTLDTDGNFNQVMSGLTANTFYFVKLTTVGGTSADSILTSSFQKTTIA